MKAAPVVHAACLIAALLGGGCSMREMKGSPFYTGDYEVTVPDAETRRVNFWPLVYYRDPVISVVWPVFEHTEEHLTLRPIFSAYGDANEYWEYNALWPICHADTLTHDYRIFPYFWGTRKVGGGEGGDYHVLFPFAWHLENRFCMLLPLWCFLHDGLRDGQYTENDYWLCGPLFRYYEAPDRKAWHAGCFYDYRDVDSEERYCGYPAPLVMSWRNRKAQGLFTPLYAYAEGIDTGKTEGWSAVPLLFSWRVWDRANDEYWMLGPLGHCASGPSLEGWHAALFGHYRYPREESSYAGFPWPLLFTWQTRRDRGLFTPVFGYEEQLKDHDGFSILPPLLSWHTWKGDDHSYWLMGPLGHYEKSQDVEAWHAAFFGRYLSLKDDSSYAGMPWPLFFSWRNRQAHGLFTPLYAYQEDNSGAGTAGSSALPPPLYWHSWAKGDDDRWFAGPLCRYRTGAEVEAWHATLFGRYRYLKDDCEYAGYPWPLAFSWRNKYERGVFTPLYASKERTSNNVTDGAAAIPLLLAWQTWQNDTKNTYALAGLYGDHRTKQNHTGHLFPLYAYNERDRNFATLLFGWDKPDESNPNGYWYGPTPLFGIETGVHNGSWLFPLYSYERNDADGSFSANVLLLGGSSHSHHNAKHAQTTENTTGFFPLFNHSYSVSTNRTDEDDAFTEHYSHRDFRLVLNYSFENQTVTHAATHAAGQPATNRAESVSRKETSDGLFPLWSSSSVSEKRLDGSLLRANSDSSLLFWLYDAKTDFTAAGDKVKAKEHARYRILWQFWRYEKTDGNVCVDMFPAITHDTRTDGFSKTSFLWRLYRYEKHPEGGVDFDLLFLPLCRAKR